MCFHLGVVWTDITFEYTPCGAPERQKATRHLKKLQKRLDTLQIDSAKYAALQEEADIAAIDLDYTLYYPLDQKYQSLYPLQPPKGETGGKPGDEDRGEIELSKRSRASKPKLWDVVAQCRETGRLEALRDGRLGDGSMKVDEEQVESGSSYNKVKKKKRKDTLREVEEEGSEEGSEKGSDGGFFEEWFFSLNSFSSVPIPFSCDEYSFSFSPSSLGPKDIRTKQTYPCLELNISNFTIMTIIIHHNNFSQNVTMKSYYVISQNQFYHLPKDFAKTHQPPLSWSS